MKEAPKKPESQAHRHVITFKDVPGRNKHTLATCSQGDFSTTLEYQRYDEAARIRLQNDHQAGIRESEEQAWKRSQL